MKLLIFGLLSWILIVGCKTNNVNTKYVDVYFNSSDVPDIDRYHVKLLLNNKILSDTILKRSIVFNYVQIKHFGIDTNQSNAFELKINNKSAALNLNNIHLDTINIVPKFNRNKVREMYHNYLRKTLENPKDYFAFIDSLKRYNKDFLNGVLDSLSLQVLSEKPR